MRLEKFDACVFLSFFFLLLDQLSKEVILRLNFWTERGSGLFFSLSQSPTYYFLILFLLIVTVFYLNLRSCQSGLEILASALLVGGALGNAFDHFYRHAAVDFLNLNWFLPFWPARFASAFNLADVFMMLGLLSFGVAAFLNQNRRR